MALKTTEFHEVCKTTLVWVFMLQKCTLNYIDTIQFSYFFQTVWRHYFIAVLLQVFKCVLKCICERYVCTTTQLNLEKGYKARIVPNANTPIFWDV